jgi:hypothetical protein
MTTQIELHIGERPTGVIVRPDSRWPGMWRIVHGDRVSDMVNLTRAKDAAIAWAMPRGLGNYKANWILMESDAWSPPSDFSEGPATTLADHT